MKLQFDTLEGRECPAISLLYDYSLDTTGFFSNPEVRQTFEAAGNQLVSRLTSSLAAITPSGNNSWQARFNHPVTGNEVRVSNLNVPADTLIVYAGGMDGTGAEAGLGGPGGYWASGTRTFQANVAKRGQAEFGPWGGSVSFDLDTNWYFGRDAITLQNGQVDFYSVATHELGHLLGFGTASSWWDDVRNGAYSGETVARLHGTSVQLSGDQAHYVQGTLSNGLPVSMRPVMDANFRVPFSELDYAALADIGWGVSGLSAASSAATTVSSPTATEPPLQTITEPGRQGTLLQALPVSHSPLNVSADKITVVSNPANGTVQIFIAQNGGLVAAGAPFSPFSGFLGEVRSTVADVNNDQVGDLIFGTGPNGGSRVRILDGNTFQDVVPSFLAFEPTYTGGVFVAAADLDRDGRAEIIVTPDQGGGGRVQVIKLNNNTHTSYADFFGINDPNFRGGARASAGDVNNDGIPDLIVSAGFGGGPRIAVFDGSTLATTRRNLVPDFFAFEPTLRNGAYVTIGDLEGDGTNDLVFGAGPGGAPRVLAISCTTLMNNGSAVALAQPTANGFVGDTNQRGGVRVSVKDLDGTGKEDLVVGSGSSSEVRVLQTQRGNLVSSSVLSPFGTINSTTDGVYVG